jgi:hypothetical protein
MEDMSLRERKSNGALFGFPVSEGNIIKGEWENLGSQDQGQQRHAAVQAISHL